MTWKELLGSSADDWEKLSDEELTNILKPFFNVTRPELATKELHNKEDRPVTKKTKATGGPNQLAFDKLKAEIMRHATQAGILLKKPL